MSLITNKPQLSHLCAALIDSVTPSPFMPHEGVQYVCHNLLNIHQLTVRIARSNRLPFEWRQVRIDKSTQESQARVSPLGMDFIKLLTHLDLTHVYQLFSQHEFHPLIHLFIDKVHQHQLLGHSMEIMMNMGLAINCCFNQIAIAFHRREFNKQCEQWLDPIQTHRCEFTNHTEKLLKAQSQYLISRVELGYGNADRRQGIHATQMLHHWQQLVERLKQELSTDGLLAAFWNPDWIAGYGYRYSLLLVISPLLSENSLVASKERLTSYWMSMAGTYGTGIIQGANPLPYRHGGCGLVEQGDKVKKQQVDWARTYMTQSHYLVRPAIEANFGFISILHDDSGQK